MALFDNLSPDDSGSYPGLLYLRLRSAINDALVQLSQERAERRLNQVAWQARNILELRVWVAFCSIDEENAVDFYLDSVRDFVDMLRKIGDLDIALQQGRDEMIAFLPSDRPPHKFRTTAEAATEAGLRDEYDTYNKVLSKFTHPTAMVVCSGIPSQLDDFLSAQFVDLGQELGQDALTRLDASCMKASYEKYQDAIQRVAKANPDFKLVF